MCIGYGHSVGALQGLSLLPVAIGVKLSSSLPKYCIKSYRLPSAAMGSLLYAVKLYFQWSKPCSMPHDERIHYTVVHSSIISAKLAQQHV